MFSSLVNELFRKSRNVDTTRHADMATSAQPRPSDPSPASCVDGCVARVRTTGEERGCSYALRPCAGLRHAATFMPYLQCRARQLRASLAVCVCVLFRSTCADYLCTPPCPRRSDSRWWRQEWMPCSTRTSASSATHALDSSLHTHTSVAITSSVEMSHACLICA